MKETVSVYGWGSTTYATRSGDKIARYTTFMCVSPDIDEHYFQRGAGPNPFGLRGFAAGMVPMLCFLAY